MGTSAECERDGNSRKKRKKDCLSLHFSPLLITSFALSFLNNRPFPSCSKPLFHGEAKCDAIDFHKKGFALSLVLKVRVLGTILNQISPPKSDRE